MSEALGGLLLLGGALLVLVTQLNPDRGSRAVGILGGNHLMGAAVVIVGVLRTR